MNAETSDLQENSVAVVVKVTVILTHVLAPKLVSNARYVTPKMILLILMVLAVLVPKIDTCMCNDLCSYPKLIFLTVMTFAVLVPKMDFFKCNDS
jgi:hypothetical protein